MRDHRKASTIEEIKRRPLCNNCWRTVSRWNPAGRSNTEGWSAGPEEWYPSKADKASWAPCRCICNARGLTLGLWLDWERLRVKDMIRTLNSFLSARSAKNRQEQCDTSLDQTKTVPSRRCKSSRPHNKTMTITIAIQILIKDQDAIQLKMHEGHQI
jgi:hypothetical protein